MISGEVIFPLQMTFKEEEGRPMMVKRKLDGTVDKSSADCTVDKSSAD